MTRTQTTKFTDMTTNDQKGQTWTTKFTDMTTNDYKSRTQTTEFTDRLQKLNLDYKTWTYTIKLGLGLKGRPKFVVSAF